jgi:hypothetical protein
MLDRPFALDGKLGWMVALVIGAAYLAFLMRLTSFPQQDYPNHVARGVVMADLLFQHGARFGDGFALQWMAVPYILGDLVLASCVHLFGTTAGAAVFSALVLLSLPVITVFAVLAVLRVSAGGTMALALAMLLAVGNLAYLEYHVGQNDEWMSRYREVVRAVPRGVAVLSIYAGPQADSRPFVHAGTFVVIDRGGLTPYLFSADHGDPMLYFRSRRQRYRPAEDWYGERRKGSSTARPDWRRVACDYDFLLLTVPFDPHEIGLPTRTVAMNPSAALLEVQSDQQGCPRR